MAGSALLRTRAEGWTMLVRLMVGLVVFLPEGIQKPFFGRSSAPSGKGQDDQRVEDDLDCADEGDPCMKRGTIS
jgi:hypothetical protein